MDLTLGEIIRAAAQDKPSALNNKSLWNCDSILERNPVCPSGLNRIDVILALREEAILRGFPAIERVDRTDEDV